MPLMDYYQIGLSSQAKAGVGSLFIPERQEKAFLKKIDLARVDVQNLTSSIESGGKALVTGALVIAAAALIASHSATRSAAHPAAHSASRPERIR